MDPCYLFSEKYLRFLFHVRHPLPIMSKLPTEILAEILVLIVAKPVKIADNDIIGRFSSSSNSSHPDSLFLCTLLTIIACLFFQE